MNKIGPSPANSSGRLTLHRKLTSFHSYAKIPSRNFDLSSAENRTFLECRSQQSPNMTDNRTHSEVAGGLTCQSSVEDRITQIKSN